MTHLGYSEAAARQLGADAAVAAICHQADKLRRAERIARNARRSMRGAN